MALRPENVLFINDNASNRGEAEFYCPDIMTASPEILPILFNNVDIIGKDDHES